MFRWVNKIIEFIQLTREMDKIGINELDEKVKVAQRRKEAVAAFVEAVDKKGVPRFFKRLKLDKRVAVQLHELSLKLDSFDKYDSYDGSGSEDELYEEEEVK